MDVRAHMTMLFHLDKCIGCHTCSVACKNLWTDRKGAEYMWWNNVETRPGTGYPTGWEDQDHYRGGWKKTWLGIDLRVHGRTKGLANLFYNPALPELDDYYEPFTFRYEDLFNAPEGEHQPTAIPISAVTEQPIEIKSGPNWDDDLSGSPVYAANDPSLEGVSDEVREQMGEIERVVFNYLPRICNHCLNPACVAACPSGAIYKRGEDGVVLVNEDECRAWRMCVSACPYKKVYYNWSTGKSEKCTLCYPRIESGNPTVCSETCVGRIRYLGVMLYDADKIKEAASVENTQDLYDAQLGVFLDPNDPAVIEAARADGIPEDWIKGAQESPIWKMAMDWKVAFPLHPEYRTLPMVWYIPPLSPIQNAAEAGAIGMDAGMPDVKNLRIPVKYLANMLTAGDEAPVVTALERMLAMRSYMRSKTVEGVIDEGIAERVGLSGRMIEDMYKIMALADYEDRFVIPTTHREQVEDAYDLKGGCGFTDSNGCSTGISKGSLFGGSKKPLKMPAEVQ